MSFFDFESGFSNLAHDRRKEDRVALATKLKAKLRELQAAGLDVDLEDDIMADEVMNQPSARHDIVAS